MSRTPALAAAFLLLATAGPARAQMPNYLPAGSTPQGDYLRGLGVSAVGEGILEVDNAIATSINTDTFIRWNEYLSAVFEYTGRKHHERLKEISAERNAAIREREKRIAENPEGLDVEKGDALNRQKDVLLGPAVSESGFKFAKVTLPVEMVRKIPFKIGRESLTFSMARITARGTAKWSPALQDPRFVAVRRAYDRAVDKVIEEQQEGKMRLDDIHRVGEAIDDLEAKLREVLPADGDKLFMDAKRRIDEFRKCYEQILKSHDVQLAVADLDRYAGTTVRDLIVFMRKHRLEFGAASTPEERKLYPEIHELLREQKAKLDGTPGMVRKADDARP